MRLPWVPPPDPQLKPGPVFVASGGAKNGPVKSALLLPGPVSGKHEGTGFGLDISCFEYRTAGPNDVLAFVVRNGAASYFRGSLRRQVAQKGPRLIPLKDPPRVMRPFCLERPHLGP